MRTKLIEFHLIFHLIILFFMIAIGVRGLDNIPRVDDDGSQSRHMYWSMAAAAALSSVFPTLGDDIVVFFGDKTETNKAEGDFQMDMAWNRKGARVGNFAGTTTFCILALFWICIIVIHKKKILRVTRKRKYI